MQNPLRGFKPEVYQSGLTQHKSFMMNMWVLTDPSGVSDVLVKKSSSFRKSNLNQRIIEPVSKEGLITTHTKQWKRQRKALAPIFRPRHMDTLSESISDVISDFLSNLDCNSHRSIELKTAMSDLSFDMLAKTLLGDAKQASDRHLRQAANTAIETCGILRLSDFLPLLSRLPRPLSPKALAAIKVLKDGARQVLKSQHERGDKFNLVALLAQQGHQQLPLNEQVDNLTGFFIAGHETTAIAMTWALYLIAHHDDTQTRIREELLSISPSQVTYKDLSNMPFTKAVFYEAMRLFPSIPIIGREVIDDVEILGQSFKKGETVIIPIYVMHRSERFWPQANQFDPDRFMRRPELMSPKNSYYLPFGAGHRVCIGAAFAMMESLLLIANLLHNFEIGLEDKNIIKPIVTISLRPDKPIWLTYKKIKNNVRCVQKENVVV